MDIWLSFLTGAAGAAVCSGIFSIVQMVIRRLWEKSDKGSAQTKALRYLMLYIMMQTAKGHIRDGEISMDDRRSCTNGMTSITTAWEATGTWAN